MSPRSFLRLAAITLAILPAIPQPAAAYLENHPGLAVEWLAAANGEVSDAALGDADGDGLPDLFVLSAQRLQLWRNEGQGAFAVPASSVCPLPLAAIAVADVDHDGRVDVLGAPAGASGLAFLRGLGGGQFSEPVVWPMDGVMYGKPVALDSSAHEFVVSRGSPGTGLDLLRSDGDRLVVVAHVLDGEALGQPVAADVDGDGTPDVIVSPPGQTLEVMLRRGDTFEHGASLATAHLVATLVTTDLDGDGDQDIVASGDGVQLFFNAGNGRQWSAMGTGIWLGDRPTGIVAADFDQDGRDELLMGVRWTNYSSFVAEYQCVTDPLLEHPDWFSYMFVNEFPQAPNALLPGDLNGDGRPDLVLFDGAMIGSMLTRPDGWPGAVRLLPLSGAATAVRFREGGPCDILLSGSDGLSVATLSSDGTIGTARRIGDGTAASVVDLNGDGLDDLVVTLGAGQLEVRLTGADGLPDKTTARLSGTLICAGDLDHDGRPDLLLRAVDGSLAVAWNDPHARFRKIAPIPLAPSGYSTQFAIGDIEGDGRGELIEFIQYHSYRYALRADSLNIYRVMPSGNLKPLRLTTLPDPVPDYTFPAMGDLHAANLDGHPGDELVFTWNDGGSNSGSLYVLRAGPGGTWTAITKAPLLGEVPGRLTLADLDGDGDADVACGTAEEGFKGILHIYWNDGTGDLSELWSRRIAGAYNMSATAGDLDGDGVTDLLVQLDSGYNPYGETGKVATLFGCRTPRTAPRRAIARVANVGDTRQGAIALRGITPNPAHGVFEVQWSSAANAPVTVELIDIAGRRVRSVYAASADDGRTTFDHLDTLPTGLYWIRLRQGRGVATQRVAIVR